MGDNSSPPASRRPGIAIVRPKLHADTQENRDLFKRWTKLHMRDTISLPKNEQLGGASGVLRYTRATETSGEEYIFTIVLDDVRLPGTEAFQKISQRLDLENTRALKEGEEPVLQEGDPRTGTEPMVFSIVAPSVGIFEAVADTAPTIYKSYQHVSADLVAEADVPTYTLITLTTTITREIPTPFLRFQRFCTSLVDTLIDATQQPVHATIYRHAPDAQPDMLPKIPQNEDGGGEWVFCVLVGGARGVEDPLMERMGEQWVNEMLAEQIVEWRDGLEKEGSLKEVDLKVGVWNGDMFMS